MSKTERAQVTQRRSKKDRATEAHWRRPIDSKAAYDEYLIEKYDVGVPPVRANRPSFREIPI